MKSKKTPLFYRMTTMISQLPSLPRGLETAGDLKRMHYAKVDIKGVSAGTVIKEHCGTLPTFHGSRVALKTDIYGCTQIDITIPMAQEGREKTMKQTAAEIGTEINYIATGYIWMQITVIPATDAYGCTVAPPNNDLADAFISHCDDLGVWIDDERFRDLQELKSKAMKNHDALYHECHEYLSTTNLTRFVQQRYYESTCSPEELDAMPSSLYDPNWISESPRDIEVYLKFVESRS